MLAPTNLAHSSEAASVGHVTLMNSVVENVRLGNVSTAVIINSAITAQPELSATLAVLNGSIAAIVIPASATSRSTNPQTELLVELKTDDASQVIGTAESITHQHRGKTVMRCVLIAPTALNWLVLAWALWLGTATFDDW